MQETKKGYIVMLWSLMIMNKKSEDFMIAGKERDERKKKAVTMQKMKRSK